MAPPPLAPPIDMSTVPPPHAYQAAQNTDANHDPMRFVMPVNPSGWCIAAGYLGLFSVLLVFAPIALLAGFLGMRDLKLNPNKTGKGRAWFGLVMGVLGTGYLLFMLTVLLVIGD